ncbi:MAG: hypothetical protein R2799_05645 [Crocinitomicaceae bacterium]
MSQIPAKSDVEKFLKNLKERLMIGEIIYAFRTEEGKNEDTLLELGITPLQRDEYVKNLKVEDYSSGPLKNDKGGNDVWIFGKEICHKEIYIKLFFARDFDVLCISFHKAKHPMDYPFKTTAK